MYLKCSVFLEPVLFLLLFFKKIFKGFSIWDIDELWANTFCCYIEKFKVFPSFGCSSSLVRHILFYGFILIIVIWGKTFVRGSPFFHSNPMVNTCLLNSWNFPRISSCLYVDSPCANTFYFSLNFLSKLFPFGELVFIVFLG